MSWVRTGGTAYQHRSPHHMLLIMASTLTIQSSCPDEHLPLIKGRPLSGHWPLQPPDRCYALPAQKTPHAPQVPHRCCTHKITTRYNIPDKMSENILYRNPSDSKLTCRPNKRNNCYFQISISHQPFILSVNNREHYLILILPIIYVQTMLVPACCRLYSRYF